LFVDDANVVVPKNNRDDVGMTDKTTGVDVGVHFVMMMECLVPFMTILEHPKEL
jgi:hypothetical protein